MTTAPSARQHLVGTALRHARQAMGFTLETAADILSCDRSKISRIENGERGIRAEELRALLAEYGITGPHAATLTWLAHPHRQKGWWQDFPGTVTASERDHAIIEAAASHLSIHQASHIPALLQTSGYARAALAQHPRMPSENEDQAIAALLARQKAILTSPERRIEVILTEGTLRQKIGSEQVMTAQIRHLITLTEQHPGLNIQVLPYSAGAHPGLWTGPVTILRFPPSPLGAICHPGLHDTFRTDDPDTLALHVRAFTQTSYHADTPNDSLQRMHSITR